MATQKCVAILIIAIIKDMPEQAPSFEHAALEADMKLLVQEIAKHRESPESAKLSEMELLKKVIKTMPPQVAQKKKDEDKKSTVLPSYALDAPPEVRLEVEYLLDIVFHHGIGRAVREADKSADFVRDVFHDTLVKILTPELKKRGAL